MAAQPVFTCRCLILRGGALLLEKGNSGYRIPEVTAQATGHVVGNVTSALRVKYGVTVAGLFWPEPKVRNPDYTTPRVFVLEAICGEKGTLSAVSFNDSADIPEREVLEQCPEGPFCRPGWLDELREWIESQAPAAGLSLIGTFTHLKGDSNYSLVRFETNSMPLWFKAPFPGFNETALTMALAQGNQDAVLPVLAHHRSWNGFLTQHMDSELLGRVWEKEVWCEAARVMARIQLTWAGRDSEIVQFGCRDHRLPVIGRKLVSFFDGMEDVFAVQPAEPPPRLGCRELQELLGFANEACERLSRYPIPASLCHADVAPHNILVVREGIQSRCLYIDWAMAYLSHPFLPFEHLVARMKKDRDFVAPWEPELRAAYAAEWSTYISPEQANEIFRWTAPLAPLLYALQRFDLFDWQYRLTEGGPRLRSLIRAVWAMVKGHGKQGYHQTPLASAAITSGAR
jgi:hypothetical protein